VPSRGVNHIFVVHRQSLTSFIWGPFIGSRPGRAPVRIKSTSLLSCKAGKFTAIILRRNLRELVAFYSKLKNIGVHHPREIEGVWPMSARSLGETSIVGPVFYHNFRVLGLHAVVNSHWRSGITGFLRSESFRTLCAIFLLGHVCVRK
jgi:hypothetical protein